ncbi:MAG TPA: hypothetical protein VMV92_36305 [Streptosporangiaceae bacterium]|nr:hypothetical protein [Streptosporangiaceae bacterium]
MLDGFRAAAAHPLPEPPLAPAFCISIPRFVLRSLVSGGVHRYSVKGSRRLARKPTH